MNKTPSGIRIDKWLWAARFYKTRQLAIKAIKNSQVKIQNQSIKPASNVHINDLIYLKRGLYDIEVKVLELSENRGPAKIAQSLYEETQDSITARERLKQQLDSQPNIVFDHRKPDRRSVRSHRALKRGTK